MSAGAELFEAESWLKNTLAAGTVLCALIGGTATPRIYSEFVPQGGTVPAVIISEAGSEDEFPVTGTPSITNCRFRVRAVVQDTSYSGAAAIMAQVQPLLGGKRGTVLSGTVPILHVDSCIRVTPFRYPETLGGLQYRHYGAEYSLWVQNP